MSFSQEVKNEILRRKISKPCCNMAAAYAVACFGKYFDDRGVVLQTENEGVAHFAQKLYRRCGVQGTVISKERPTGPVYEFSVKDPDEVAKMLALFGHTGKEPTLRIRPENFKCQNCMQAFIATAFLCCGTMTDPEKSYNLEFLSTRHYLSQQLEAMLAEHNFHPHRALRKGANTIYIKAAASWIFFMRWESPALLTGGSNFCASLASGRSGYCIRSLAVWRRVSGRVFSAPAACSFSIASCTCTAAFTLLLMLAVSQLERRFVLLRISLYMRWSMIRMAAPPAPIKVSRSSI